VDYLDFLLSIQPTLMCRVVFQNEIRKRAACPDQQLMSGIGKINSRGYQKYMKMAPEIAIL
jgi:hypothetical protein